MSGVLFYNKCRIKTDVLTRIQLTEAEEKDVNFYDYDGFRLLSYTNAEALALTELPANPAINENLTFDEWNWTLAAIKSQINNVGGVVNVGAIYHTTDDKSHITCKPTVKYPQASICLTPTVANTVSVDWGDGSSVEIFASNDLNQLKSHTYTGVTDSSVYDITISCTSGTYDFSTYFAGSSTYNLQVTYTDIKLSNKVTGIGYCENMHLLKTINIPTSITTLKASSFKNVRRLQCVNVPSTVTSIPADCFYQCNSAEVITFSNTVTSLAAQSFLNCFSLHSITIPIGVSTMDTRCFQYCYSIKTLSLPNNMTPLPNRLCYGCHSLENIIIPDSVTDLGQQCFVYAGFEKIHIPRTVTSIATECFASCYGLRQLYVMPTTPPALGASNAISNNANLVIYVPTGYLSTYQNAEYWSTFAAKMVEYNF